MVQTVHPTAHGTMAAVTHLLYPLGMLKPLKDATAAGFGGFGGFPPRFRPWKPGFLEGFFLVVYVCI